MSRSLDIAKILRATENNNPNNNKLVWEIDALDSASIQSVGIKYYSQLDSLPTTGLSAGIQALVEENRRLYISDGNGWYSTTLTNASPRWIIEPGSTYQISDSSYILNISAKAVDSDNINFLDQSFASDSAQYMVDITRDSSVFTFTPKSAASVAAAVAAGNLSESNGDFTYTFKWSDGINFIAKPATISYTPGLITYNWGLIENMGGAQGGYGVVKTGNGTKPFTYFKDNGTKFVFLTYNGGGNGGSQTWYELGAPYDFTTNTRYNHYASSYSEPFLNYINEDGTYAYVVGVYSVSAWPLSTAWDLSTYSSASAGATIGSGLTFNFGTMTELKLYDKGRKMILMDSYGDAVTYNLSTAYDVLTASMNTQFATRNNSSHILYTAGGGWQGFAWADDGRTLFGFGGARVLYQYTASTPWDINTLTLVSSVSLPLGQLDLFGLEIDHQNGRLYYVHDYDVAGYWNVGVTSS